MATPSKIFSLLDVTRSIQKTLTDRYSSVFWVKAEMNKLNYYPHSGHCYPDLVEKRDGRVIAQLRSVLWRDDYTRINHLFLRVVKTDLKDGITILFRAKIAFDPVHGLSLNILDIDPAFSLGELEREKLETIGKLKEASIYNTNKLLKLPLVPKRIAVISVQTSKGYADFLNVIGNNSRNYKFLHVLFPSVLQGERAVESIIYQLKRIRRVIHHFDVVAIIRGGGGEVGLSCFNNYELAKEIALFPIPVITGIGHATNETVAEMVSHKNAITPTDLANYLLERFHDFAGPVRQAEEIILERGRRLLREEHLKFQNTAKYFRSITGNILIKQCHVIENSMATLAQQADYLLQKQKKLQETVIHEVRAGAFTFCKHHHLDIMQQLLTLKKAPDSLIKNSHNSVNHLERSVSNMSPENVLRRGYSITTVNGNAIKSIHDVKPSDSVNTVLPDGTITSEVKSVNPPINE